MPEAQILRPKTDTSSAVREFVLSLSRIKRAPHKCFHRSSETLNQSQGGHADEISSLRVLLRVLVHVGAHAPSPESSSKTRRGVTCRWSIFAECAKEARAGTPSGDRGFREMNVRVANYVHSGQLFVTFFSFEKESSGTQLKNCQPPVF